MLLAGLAMSVGRFDVFLSHNSRDKPAVERLAEKLKRAGLEPWFDRWCRGPVGGGDNAQHRDAGRVPSGEALPPVVLRG